MKKKGFTLVELLAVIIILAVIALIATPIVLDVVESSRKSAFESSTYGIVDTIKLKTAENMLAGLPKTKTYTFPTEELEMGGSQPKGGSAQVDSSGRIAIAIHNGDWCAIKGFTEGVVNIIDYTAETCVIPSDEVVYTPGTLLKIQLGEGSNNVGNFYVLEDNGEELKLIMDRNMGDNIEWISETDLNSYVEENEITLTDENKYATLKAAGPITANTQIEAVRETWTNASEIRMPLIEDIMGQVEWYKNLEDKSAWETQYVTYMEGIDWPSCNSNAECRAAYIDMGIGEILVPQWLDINLYTSGDDTDRQGNTKYAYWVNEPSSVVPGYAFVVNCYGSVDLDGVGNSAGAGVRPVITINESYVIERIYTPGTLLKIQLGEGSDNVVNFYVLEDNGEELKLIMDRNLGDNIAWISSADLNAYVEENEITLTNENKYATLKAAGPITANTQIDAVRETWTNASEIRIPNVDDIMEHVKWYQDLEDKSTWEEQYWPYASTLELPECGSNAECFDAYTEVGYGNILIPKWLSINLYTSGDDTDDQGNEKEAYWINEPSSVLPYVMFDVNYIGTFYACEGDDSDYAGVRPVITINESNIIEELQDPIYVNPDTVVTE